MSHPHPSPLARASEREVWVEAQAWERCVRTRASKRATRRTDGIDGAETSQYENPAQSGLKRPFDRIEELSEVLDLADRDRRALEEGLETLDPAQRSNEVAKLLDLAYRVQLLSSLTPRSAPAALDARVMAVRGGCVAAATTAAPAITPNGAESDRALVEVRRAEEELQTWMSALPRVPAPIELDQFIESEIARMRDHDVAPVKERTAAPTPWSLIGGDRTAAADTPFRSVESSPEAPVPSLVIRRRWKRVAVLAAALIGLAGVGLLIRSLTQPGVGNSDATFGAQTRFSFRYVDVDVSSADVKDRPALRLLRGWASHISPAAIEQTEARK